jgi:protease IV
MKNYLAWLAKFLTAVLVSLFVIPFLLVGLVVAVGKATQSSEGSVSGDSKARVAVIELKGVIMQSKEVVEDIYKQVKDDSIKAIVLAIDSPGGAVGPSQDIFRTVQSLKARKPIVAAMGSVAASGGLYSALGASKIFAQEGTLTGSIGVIMQIPNFSGVTEKVGFDMVTIKSGKLKDAGNSFRPMSEEERGFLQSTADQIQKGFVEAVATGRGISEDKVREFADGRVIVGARAKEIKLIDEVGGVYDAARAALTLAGVTLEEGEDPELVYTDDKFANVKKFFGTLAESGAAYATSGILLPGSASKAWLLMQ